MMDRFDTIRNIAIADFDYPLPDERIAKHPLAERDRCKLLVRRSDGHLEDRLFSEIDAILPADTMMVCNNTRVINARLHFCKGDDNSGSLIEILCLEPDMPRDYARNFASSGSCSWSCFVGNSKRWKDAPLTMPLTVDGCDITLTATRLRKEGNVSVVEFSWNNRQVTFARIISVAGEIPIPPYLNRSTESSDSVDYQTVYSRIDGSVAAPTAGLHFTDAVLSRIGNKGIPCRELTLHVGAGTFQPVKSDTIGDHPMHSEFIAVDRALIAELAATERHIVAVGTTSVRTLESLYHIGCMISQGQWTGELPQWYPYSPEHPGLSRSESFACILRYVDEKGMPALIGATRMIIAPGYVYRVVEGMVTNFHQPRSTLLLLVSAFVGGDWRPIYDFALASSYRFLSYGDASLLLNF